MNVPKNKGKKWPTRRWAQHQACFLGKKKKKVAHAKGYFTELFIFFLWSGNWQLSSNWHILTVFFDEPTLEKGSSKAKQPLRF